MLGSSVAVLAPSLLPRWPQPVLTAQPIVGKKVAGTGVGSPSDVRGIGDLVLADAWSPLSLGCFSSSSTSSLTVSFINARSVDETNAMAAA